MSDKSYDEAMNLLYKVSKDLDHEARMFPACEIILAYIECEVRIRQFFNSRDHKKHSYKRFSIRIPNERFIFSRHTIAAARRHLSLNGIKLTDFTAVIDAPKILYSQRDDNHTPLVNYRYKVELNIPEEASSVTPSTTSTNPVVTRHQSRRPRGRQPTYQPGTFPSTATSSVSSSSTPTQIVPEQDDLQETINSGWGEFFSSAYESVLSRTDNNEYQPVSIEMSTN